jgi:RHS repeat-associated protein
VLLEIRAPAEPNSRPQDQESNTSPGDPHLGRVAYAHAGGIDRPLELVRLDYEPVAMVPHSNWLGTYDLATYTGTRYAECGLAIGYPLGHLPPCHPIEFPSISAFHEAKPRNWDNTETGPLGWYGGLIEGKRDASGLLYMRNRYYDAKSGRFTQEDPIGLAGGLNLYGYANGDPVNFSDPFGLCTDLSDPKCRAMSARGEGRDVIIVYSDGETTHEQVRSGGTRAWRNNNPGNLRGGSFSTRHGSIGTAGNFAVFGDLDTGGQAQAALLTGSTYGGLSIDDAIARYAPASENNTARYQAIVRRAAGVDGSTLMRDLTAEQMQSVLAAMRRHEGFRAGTVEWRPVQ